MRVRWCGVRGSTPAPGAAFVEVGGSTSCVAVWATGAEDGPPTLVLDAGTGLQHLSAVLGDVPFRGTILLTHLHWDHTHGLPFFPNGDRDDARVRLLLPDQGEDAVRVLARAMSPPHFPIGPDGLRGDWAVAGIGTGDHVVEGLLVTAFEVPHKGGRTFGYRIDDGIASLAYLPDHLPAADGPDPVVVAHVRGVDAMVHDAQFTAAERDLARRFGHATVDEAVALARAADVERLVLFHHAPARTDAEVAEVTAAARDVAAGHVEVDAAREGEELLLGRADPLRTGGRADGGHRLTR